MPDRLSTSQGRSPFHGRGRAVVGLCTILVGGTLGIALLLRGVEHVRDGAARIH